jgi:hypothetical protein
MDGSSKHTVFDLATRGAKKKTCEGGFDRNVAQKCSSSRVPCSRRYRKGRRLQALLLQHFPLLVLLHREGVRTRRDENGKNAVPKLRRAGRVGLLGLRFIAKLAIIHNKI